MTELESLIFATIKNQQLMAVATITDDGKPWVRYVVGFGDERFVVRFITSLKSRKVNHLRNNPEIHIVCGVSQSDMTHDYLQIQGRAKIITDPAVKRAYWNDGLAEYFKGPEDPDYCVIETTPVCIEHMTASSPEPAIWKP